MKKKLNKVADIVAKKQMIGCPNKQALVDIASGTFKASVTITKTSTGHYLAVDGGDASTAFARILQVNGEKEETKIAEILAPVIEKEHEVNNFTTDGSNVTGDLCQIVIDMGKTRKKSTASDENASYNGQAADFMQEKVDEMVKLGAMDKKHGDKILEYLSGSHILDDAMLCKRIAGYWKSHWEHFGNKDPKSVKWCSPFYEDVFLDDLIKVDKEGMISKGLRSILMGHGVCAQGGKSVGKNIWCDTLAFILNVPVSLLTFSDRMSPSVIYGEKTTDNSAIEDLYTANAKNLAQAAIQGDVESQAEFELMKARSSSVRIVVDQSELFDALQYGRLMIFNEMNLADANMFASFCNQILDGTGFLFIPGRGEVEVPREFAFVGTQNVDYEGCQTQNEATVSRIGFIDFSNPLTIIPQLKAATEAELAKDAFFEWDEKLQKEAEVAYAKVEKFYNAIKAATESDSNVGGAIITETSLNIRGCVRACTEYLASGGYTTLKSRMAINVVNSINVAEEKQAVMSILNKYCS